MLEQDKSARIRAAIEEELGTLRQFADLPSSEIEQMAARITQAIGGLLSDGRGELGGIRAA